MATMPSAADAGPKPTLLMFHAGGFAFGDPSLLDYAAEIGRSRGFRTVQVDYPLGDPGGALAFARALAEDASRGKRQAFAYGESAGGSLAARLAELGAVDAAVGISPVADVVSWADETVPDPEWQRAFLGSTREQRRVSPAFYPVDEPLLVTVGREEEGVIADGIESWVATDPGVELRRVAGKHLGDGGDYGRIVNRALGWLARTGQRGP